MINLNNIQLKKHKSYVCFEEPGINPVDIHVSITNNDSTVAFLNWTHGKTINMEYTFETIKSYYPLVSTYLIAIWDWDIISQTTVLDLGFILKETGIIDIPNLNVLIYQIIL